MEPVDPTVIGTLSIASGIAVAMLLLGSRAKMLELREREVRCQSCRRFVRRGSVCSCAR